MYHCNRIRTSLFVVWSTKNGKNVDWRLWANCFSISWRTLWYVLECLPRAEMLRWSQTALLATAMGLENVYLCFDTVKMAKVLTGIHERAGFPGLEELFHLSMAILYTIHPRTFLMSPLHSLSLKCGFWYTICHTFDILDQVICVIVLMAAILDAILNLTPSARDPDCPPKFFLLT